MVQAVLNIAAMGMTGIGVGVATGSVWFGVAAFGAAYCVMPYSPR